MRSGTSYFDRTVFKKTVCRFWPLWGAYFVFWLVTLPLSGLMMLRMDSNYSYTGVVSYMEGFAMRTVPRSASDSGLVLAVVFGVLCAMAVFSHLYSARSANLYGSLPIRREGLFLTHYLAGLAFMLVPNLVIFLLCLIVEAAGGYVSMQALLFWLGVMCGECFLFYSMAVFCAMFTGHILALPAFYGILNALVVGVTGLVTLVLNAFWYGYVGMSDITRTVVSWFTPVWMLAEEVRGEYVVFPTAIVNGVAVQQARELQFSGLGVVGIYALAAVALTVCAFFLYRARRLESAGDVVSVKFMRPVFRYGVGFCGGLALGIGTLTVIGGRETTFVVASLIWGVVCAFAAQMLLDKSFKVFKKWKGAAATAAVLGVLFLVVALDLTGFETRVPDPADVVSVEVRGLDAQYFWDDGDYLEGEFSDPELVKLIVGLHQNATEQRGWFHGGGYEWITDMPANMESVTFRVTYHLNGGRTLLRRYNLWYDPATVRQENTPAWAMQKLYDDREVQWQVYGFDVLEDDLANKGWRMDEVQFYYHADDQDYTDHDYQYFYGNDALALYEAVKEDFFAGRIGARTVVDGDARYPRDRGYERTLRFGAVSGDDKYSWSVEIFVTDTAASTLAALERLEAEGAGGASVHAGR